MAADNFFVSDSLKETLSLPNILHDRHEIVTALMNYVKENNLIDTQNKMVYHTNSVLAALMNGKKATSAFSAIRDFGENVEKVDDDDTVTYSEESSEQGEGQLEAHQQLETENQFEDEGEDEGEDEEGAFARPKEGEQWHRELTVQNDQGKCLTLTCVRRSGESMLSINGVEMYESEFEDYYERVVGNKPSGFSQGMDMCIGLGIAFTFLTVTSLWISLVNQGLMRC